MATMTTVQPDGRETEVVEIEMVEAKAILDRHAETLGSSVTYFPAHRSATINTLNGRGVSYRFDFAPTGAGLA